MFSFSFSREGLRERSHSLTTGIKTMKADVTQHSLDVPKAALAADNPILGTWKLQSLVYEVSAKETKGVDQLWTRIPKLVVLRLSVQV